MCRGSHLRPARSCPGARSRGGPCSPSGEGSTAGYRAAAGSLLPLPELPHGQLCMPCVAYVATIIVFSQAHSLLPSVATETSIVHGAVTAHRTHLKSRKNGRF